MSTYLEDREYLQPAQEAFEKRVPRISEHLHVTDGFDPDLRGRFVQFAFDLIYKDYATAPLPETDSFDARIALGKKELFLSKQVELIPKMMTGMGQIVAECAQVRHSTGEPSPFTYSLGEAHPDLKGAIARITYLCGELMRDGLFSSLGSQLFKNQLAADGPVQDSKLPTTQLIDTYLKDTLLHGLFAMQLPIPMTLEQRLSHTWVLAPSGAGKTTLLENLVLHYLSSPEKPGLIIFDPHSNLIEKIKNADLGIEDRLLIIDPRDRFPAALNIFAVNQSRMGRYDDVMQEQLAERVIETFTYFFKALDVELTGKQGVFTRYLLRFLLSFPDTLDRAATIADMFLVLPNPGERNPHLPEPYITAVERLDDFILKDFMEHHFLSKNYAETAQQLKTRLHGVIESPALRRMFGAPDTKIDFYEAMNRGDIILVDSASDYLGHMNGGIFSGTIMGLILQAIHERAAIPENERRPCFAIIDEAGLVFQDSNIEQLLTDARKFKLGLVCANHTVQQAASEQLKASLNSVACKFIGPDAGAARFTAPNMRTTPEFITNQREYHFAAYVRGMATAVSVQVNPNLFERIPKKSQRAYDAMMERNRQKVSIPKARHRPQEPPQEAYTDYEDVRDVPDRIRLAPPRDAEDIAREW